MEKLTPWKKIGVVSVDAGLIWVGDPCYIAEGLPGKTWEGFCKLIDNREAIGFDHKLGVQGLGVCVHSGYGDGRYPVFARFNKEGRVMKIKIDFD
jgi:hypothetical protein